jgi:hypothetical protein
MAHLVADRCQTPAPTPAAIPERTSAAAIAAVKATAD